MTLKGKVVFRDVETGVWMLEAEDGEAYMLAGGDKDLKRAGARVEVSGQVRPEAWTSAMSGPTFVVSKYRFLE